MAEEVKVVLRRCEHLGFGFSLLGATGPPHVIYDIVEHSPAAESRMVEAGDVILKVNGTDVNHFTTKEVLKCLRLSEDMVTLDLRRDPMLKAKIKEQLAKNSNPHYSQVEHTFASTYNSSEVALSPKYSTDASNITKRNISTTEQDKINNSRGGNATSTTGMRYKSLKRLPSHRSQKESLISSQSDPSTAEQQSDNGKPIPLRPSRIPTVQKIAQNSNLVMSQHSRLQTSQIPTKITTAISSYATTTSSALANSNAISSVNTCSKRSPHFQHSHSISCSSGIQEQTHKKCEMEAISGPSQSAKTPRFEAYMMTGDLIINLSRTPQSNSLLTTSTKKIDSLRDSPNKVTTRINNALAPRASEESSPTSSSSLESPTRKTGKPSENVEQYSKQIQKQKSHERSNITSNNLCDVNKDYFDKVQENSNQQKRNCNETKSNRKKPNDKLADEYGTEDSLHSNESSDERSLKNITDNSITNADHRRMKNKNCVESSSTSNTICSDACGNANTSQDEFSFSAPNSPVSLSTPLLDKDTANSRSTSPDTLSITIDATGNPSALRTEGVSRRHNGLVRKCDSAGFRTSKSEDHLQQLQREGIVAVLPIDIDEDVNSSLNTLLDTRQDLEGKQGLNLDRIVWTYNAPVQSHQQTNDQMQHRKHLYFAAVLSSNNEKSNSSQTPHSSLSSSPSNTGDSSASPTSVSSSVMSSSGSKNALGNCENGDTNDWNTNLENYNIQQTQQWNQQTIIKNNKDASQCPSNEGGVSGVNNLVHNSGGDQSISEAISNISSPDYQEDNNLLSSRDLLGGMTLSDPSDSDSTILVSDTGLGRHQQQIFHHKDAQPQFKHQEHKLVIKVRGNGNNCSQNSQHHSIRSGSDVPCASDCKNLENELRIATEIQNAIDTENCTGESSPPVSEDGSDVESLHSYHYSPKGVDMPSAIRLAKRLYSLDGFKKSDVSRHLSKNNDFSRAVADEYLKNFDFKSKTLDQALREFLKAFALSGETQERERVLVHFSRRYLDCNPDTFNSQDAVHTLTCAIMLLNTDLHGQNIGRKMTCIEFLDNLAELNDGENFPKELLKHLYHSIKTQPIKWAFDDDEIDIQKPRIENNFHFNSGAEKNLNPFLDLPESSTAVEYKKGYMMRKCCFDASYKKTPFGKRSWKMFYCTLRDLVLYLHKDEHGFRKCQVSDNLHNAIRIHHALATKATDYIKKQHVFRLQTADQAEYLFQTSDSKELQSWVDTINFVCASYSAPPLEGGIGSQKRFQRPLLPCTHTKYSMKEQVNLHENQMMQFENLLSVHRKLQVPHKGLPLQNYREKECYLQFELRRYNTYVSILKAKLQAQQHQATDVPQSENVPTTTQYEE